MTTWYVDLVGGNNSNNGETFANRMLTIAAVPANAGDTIRVMGNAPTSSGTATWTNGSSLVTLSAALTQLLYADGAWAAGTHVTCSAVTSSPYPKQGTNCAKMVCASTFTTGKVAYHATGTLTLSGYQQISFWIQSSVALAAGTLEIALCSDTAGATAVNTLTLNQPLNANQWTNVTLNNGAAFSSTSVKSINITALTSLASVDIYIDDVVACNAPAAAGCLTLGTLISPNNQTWYPVQSVDGTTVYLDGTTNFAATDAPGWQGSSGTPTFYLLQPTQSLVGTGYAQTFSLNGTAGSPVIISGGWDSVSMSTQSGWTTIDLMDGASNAIDVTGTTGYVTIDHVNFARASTAVGFVSTSQGCTLSNSTSSGVSNIFYSGVTYDTTWTLSSCNIINPNGSSAVGLSGGSAVNCNVYGALDIGIFSDGFGSVITGCNALGCGEGFFIENSPCAKFYNNTANNGGVGFTFFEVFGQVCYNLTAQGNSDQQILMGQTGEVTPGSVEIYGLNTNTPGGSTVPQFYVSGKATIYSWTQYTGSGAVLVTSGTFLAGETTPAVVYSQQENGVASDNTVYTDVGKATTTGITGEDGSAPGWQLSPNAYAFQTSPLTIKVGTVACPADQATTITYWAKLSASGISAQLRVAGGRYPGVQSPGLDITSGVSGTSWAQCTVSVTPTENCVVDVFFDTWGSSTLTATISGPVTIGQYTDYENLSTYQAEPFITVPLVNTLLFNYVYQAQPFLVANPGIITYSMDSLGRLIEVALANGTTTAFNYDKVGNRTSVVTTAGPFGL
jgi:YD repeat-containing protein